MPQGYVANAERIADSGFDLPSGSDRWRRREVARRGIAPPELHFTTMRIGLLRSFFGGLGRNARK